jgi:hypothetical protein
LTTSETCHGSHNIAGQCSHLQCSSGWHLTCDNSLCTCVENSPDNTGKYLSNRLYLYNLVWIDYTFHQQCRCLFIKRNLPSQFISYNLFKNWTYSFNIYTFFYLLLTYLFPTSTKFNDSSILITIISWDYLNLSLANEYVGDATIPTNVIKYNQCCSRQISQSDCSIHIKLNHNTFSRKL